MSMNEERLINPEEKLEEALALLAAGLPADEVPAQAGHDAAWLRPMLETALEMESLQADIPLPPPDASLQRLLDYGQELATNPSSPPASLADGRGPLATFFNLGRGLALSGTFSLVLLTALVLTFILGGLLGGGLVLAAENKLPGQLLYPVKRLGESVRLQLAPNQAEQTHLLEEFNRRRQQEVRGLLERGAKAEVSFDGIVEATDAGRVVVDSLTGEILPDAKIEGDLAVGARVHLEGVTRPPAGLIVTGLTVIAPAPVQPAPTAPPVATPTATPSPTQKPVIEATSDTIIMPPTPTATPTATPRPTNTSTPVPTPTVTPRPTDEPAEEPLPPEDNQNEAFEDEPDSLPADEDFGNDTDDTPAADENDNSSPEDEINDNEEGEEEFEDDSGNENSGDDDSGEDNSGSGNSGDDNGDDENSGSGHSDDGDSGGDDNDSDDDDD